MQMDCETVGKAIRLLRLEKEMTQKELADRMNLSDKTVSKWERGLGCPDVLLLPALSELLGADIAELLSGGVSSGHTAGGNPERTKFSVCPVCGSVTVCAGSASVSCCGRKLLALVPRTAAEDERLTVEAVEDDWYVTGDQSMTKDDYVSFIAFSAGEKLLLFKQYPEWALQARIPNRGHGMLLWYSAREGLLRQRL